MKIFQHSETLDQWEQDLGNPDQWEWTILIYCIVVTPHRAETGPGLSENTRLGPARYLHHQQPSHRSSVFGTRVNRNSHVGLVNNYIKWSLSWMIARLKLRYLSTNSRIDIITNITRVNRTWALSLQWSQTRSLECCQPGQAPVPGAQTTDDRLKGLRSHKNKVNNRDGSDKSIKYNILS